MYVMNHSFIPLTWMESFPSTSMGFDSNLEGWCIYSFSHWVMFYFGCSPTAPSSLAASASSSPVQPLACSFSYKGCHKQRQAASPLSSYMMLFLVSSAETSHQTLQNRRQQDKESLWAACHIHLLEFCLYFQMVLSRRLAPSCHPSKPFEKDLHFLLEALVLHSFIEESINASV